MSIQPQDAADTFDTFAVAVETASGVERFCFTVHGTSIGNRPAKVINGDEHFERAFAHLAGLRGRIAALVGEVSSGRAVTLPATLDDAQPQKARASA